MAKSTDILAAIEQLAALGIDLTDEQKEAVKTAKSAAFASKARVVLDRKVLRTEKTTDDVHKKAVEKWQTEMFALAAKVESGIVANLDNVGRGQALRRMFRIETPHGSFKVELSQEPEKK